MASVLTTASKVECGHSGTVSVSSTAKLHVEGNPVLVKTSIENKTVVTGTCTTKPAQGTKPCTSVSAVSAGEATKLQAGGDAVVLDTLKGGTDGTIAGTPQTLLKGTANQSKLTAS